MPTYDYTCDHCKCPESLNWSLDEYDRYKNAVMTCAFCEVGTLKRKFSFSYRMPFGEGYSPTTNSYVQGERDLREQMRIASAAATERTGIEHNYKPIDMRDTESLGITEAGLAEDNKARHDRGEPVVKVPGLDV